MAPTAACTSGSSVTARDDGDVAGAARLDAADDELGGVDQQAGAHALLEPVLAEVADLLADEGQALGRGRRRPRPRGR